MKPVARVLAKFISGRFKSVTCSTEIALQKNHSATVRGAAACRESGTYVMPEIRHVASPSIDGFGAPF
jgi:hypothetical protein